MIHPIHSPVYIMNSKGYDTPYSQPGLHNELYNSQPGYIMNSHPIHSPVYIMNSKGYDTPYSQPGLHNELKRL